MAAPQPSVRSTLLWIGAVAAISLWLLRDVALLVAYSVLVAYALLPVVKVVGQLPPWRGRPIARGVAAAIVILALLATVAGGAVLAAPRLAADATRFASNVPQAVTGMLQRLQAYATAHGIGATLAPLLENLRAGTLQSLDLGGKLVPAATRVFSGIGGLLSFTLLPLLAFYLLADSSAVRLSALSFLPETVRPELLRLLGAVDHALGRYVRGQAIVCLVMGVAVGTGLWLAHHPMALLLGALAGLAELIPFLGFLVAAIAIVLSGSTVSFAQGAIGLAIYIGLNWCIGTFVTPRVMGRYLKLHPFIITVSVLAGARVLGPAGALIALPAAAAVQAIMAEMATTAATGEPT